MQHQHSAACCCCTMMLRPLDTTHVVVSRITPHTHRDDPHTCDTRSHEPVHRDASALADKHGRDAWVRVVTWLAHDDERLCVEGVCVVVW
jgi:hypothetical protein